MSQTTIQKDKAIRAGSLKVELGTTQNSYIDIGALRDLKLESTGSNSKISFDNVPDVVKYKDGNKFKLTGKLCEINFSNIELMNGGQVVTTTVAGTQVTGATQLISSGLDQNISIELTHQNGDGTAPTITSVVGSVDGTLVIANDYTLVKVANKWTIVFVGLSTISQTVTITSTYTPNAKKVTTFNATGIKSGVFMRMTNTDDTTGKKLTFIMSGVINIAPTSIDFSGDTEDNVAEMPVELEGVMVQSEDEQQTT